MEKKFKLGVVGCGFMAPAIIKGIVNAGKLSPSQIIVSEKEGMSFSAVDGLGVDTTYDNALLATEAEYIFFAVKPQGIDDVLQAMSAVSVEKIITILAGVKKEKFKQVFPNAAVARCMPNTPCSIGCGAMAVDVNDFGDEDGKFILDLFSSLGSVLAMGEDKMNAVTGISGSGPAYVYLFIQGLVQAGINQGLTETEARTLAVNTVIGSGIMVKNDESKPLDDFIKAVCSKGGTTVEAVKTFNDNDFKGIIDKAVDACVRRAFELGGEKPVEKKTELTDNKVIIYTDGACSGNPGPGGWGAILMSGGKKKELSGSEDMTTNNRMELKAVISALEALKKPCSAEVYTDSAYVADAFNKGWIYGWHRNGWKTSSDSDVKNIDLWEKLLVLTKKHTVTFCKVKGHSDNEYNNRCDQLARAQYKSV